MDRINGADTIDIGGGRRGFRDENLVAGAAGTEVTALWLNMTQEEILKVVTEAGLVPSEGDWTQLWQALQILGLAPDRGRRWLTINSMTLSSAPGAPTVGDAYLVPVGATGIWAGNVGKIAVWFGSGWTYLTPTDGHGVSLPDGRVFERIAGSYVEKLALDVQSGKWSYAEAAGTTNALTATLVPAQSGLVTGMSFRLKIATTNTGPATLNLNGFGAKPIVKRGGQALKRSDLQQGTVPAFTYNGTEFEVDLSGSAAPYAYAVFDAPGTQNWIVPPGVSRVRARCWGGGGSGGSSTAIQNAGGGGGAGGYSEGVFEVTPGQSIAVTVGAGGSGTAGGTSSFGSFCSASGGNAGTNGSPGGVGSGGAGGSGFGGAINISGGNGSAAIVYGSSNVLEGGTGGASYGTSIVRGVGSTSTSFNGNPGFIPGGGSSGCNNSSAAGGRGLIILEY